MRSFGRVGDDYSAWAELSNCDGDCAVYEKVFAWNIHDRGYVQIQRRLGPFGLSVFDRARKVVKQALQ